MTAAIIFGLLVALMLTGMPISIALGLTVLTFLFTFTSVPIESVALTSGYCADGPSSRGWFRPRRCLSTKAET